MIKFQWIWMALAMLVVMPKVGAQQVLWKGSFDFFFDNREYDESQHGFAQTIFGVRLAPEVGLQWEERHSVMAGIDLLANFGSVGFVDRRRLIGYYQYKVPAFRAMLGAIPRNNLIGDYSRAFFSDSVSCFSPQISGLILQTRGQRGYYEFACDWSSMVTSNTREKFMLFWAGQFDFGPFHIGNHFSMFHYAGSRKMLGVVDNMLFYPFAGVNLKGFFFDKLSFRAGWMQGYQYDRRFQTKSVIPGGVQVETTLEKCKFGVNNTLYSGGNLMPYYTSSPTGSAYGSDLYWGEAFFQANLYNRLELYWTPVSNQYMHLRISSVHHLDGKEWLWQQKIILSIVMGPKRWKNLIF